MKFNDNIEILHGDCTQLLQQIPDESVDAIITDPPYLYLKNHKLDKPFDEKTFFNEAKRVLKKNGFIVMFGRGTSFYRWNTRLAVLGFVFKEEIIWNKVQTSSPVSVLNRVHETISIHTKEKGKINKTRVPYLEMKGHDIEAIKHDIKRLLAVFSNEKSLKAIENYLEHSKKDYNETIMTNNNNMLFSNKVHRLNRCVSIIEAMKKGFKEKSVIRLSSFYDRKAKAKNFTVHTGIIKGCDRCLSVMDSMHRGLREKSIIEQTREHYTMQHPTQKPVRLMERLIPLVTQEGALVVDPFMGSGTTGVACLNTNRRFIGMELDNEYFGIAHGRIESAIKEKEQDLFYEKAI